MEPQSLRIAIREETEGYSISPARIPLRTLRTFASDVEQLTRGDGQHRSLTVAVEEGSFALQLTPFTNDGLQRDLTALALTRLTDHLNARRKAIIERWQRWAKSKGRRLSFVIDAPYLPAPIVIDRSSDLHSEDADHWVRVERYVRGEVYEAGGAHDPNVHVRLPDGTPLIVAARREQLAAEPTNRLFKHVMVRFEAEYNVLTREYRDARLIAFGDYMAEPDLEQMKKLWARGAEAWADVPNAQAWVDDVRGGNE